MRPELWQPPVACTSTEHKIMARIPGFRRRSWGFPHRRGVNVQCASQAAANFGISPQAWGEPPGIRHCMTICRDFPTGVG
jgi:hypothetical protein